MDCQEIRKFLQVFIDEELDEEERLQVEDHLAQCEPCRALSCYERRFRDAIRARVPRALPSAGFRVQLRETMAGAREQWVFPRKLVWGTVPAVLVLAIMIPFAWTVTSGFSPMVDEVVDQHSSEPPVEVTSSNLDEVEGWFRKKVNFLVNLPRFQGQKFDLVGARLSTVDRQRAALIRYRRNLANFTLFVVTDPNDSYEGRSCQYIHAKKFCLTELRGYTVVIWHNRGLAYSMVGEAPAQELLELLSAATAR